MQHERPYGWHSRSMRRSARDGWRHSSCAPRLPCAPAPLRLYAAVPLRLFAASAPPLHCPCTAPAPPLHHLCTTSAPLHRLCTTSAPPLHRLCTASAPLHRLCTTSAPLPGARAAVRAARGHVAHALPPHRTRLRPPPGARP
eukprot:scaffold127540_cov69-Phaeocystis_antarctica.AAC.1